MRFATILGWGFSVALSGSFGCAARPAPAASRLILQNPCQSRRDGDECVAQLPTVPPIVAGEGRLWALFGRDRGFVVRQYTDTAQQVLVEGTCPNAMKPAVLGLVENQPAVLCVDFEHATVAYGAAKSSGNTTDFAWAHEEHLPVETPERLRDVSHFVWLQGKLAMLYRTLPDASREGAAASVGRGKWWLHVNGDSNKSEPLCPRAGISQCGARPIAFYAAEGKLHAVMPSGKASEAYLHLAHQPGSTTTLAPLADVPSVGKSLTNACVSATSDGSLRVFTPVRSLVSSLVSWQGERMGLIEQPMAQAPQGPDVLAKSETRCPPEVRSLGSFPSGSSGFAQATTQWLRASRSNETWVVAYAVQPFTVKQGADTYSYPESFWVLRRRSGR